MGRSKLCLKDATELLIQTSLLRSSSSSYCSLLFWCCLSPSSIDGILIWSLEGNNCDDLAVLFKHVMLRRWQSNERIRNPQNATFFGSSTQTRLYGVYHCLLWSCGLLQFHLVNDHWTVWNTCGGEYGLRRVSIWAVECRGVKEASMKMDWPLWFPLRENDRGHRGLHESGRALQPKRKSKTYTLSISYSTWLLPYLFINEVTIIICLVPCKTCPHSPWFLQ